MSEKGVPYRMGGVLRCCLDQPHWPESPEEGQVLPCPHGCEQGNGGLRFRDGAWEAKWIQERPGWLRSR